MKKLFILPIVLLLFSCSKKEPLDMDSNITRSDYYGTNAAGDTICRIYIPNGFTPNGDGVNDFYYISGTGISQDNFQMKILARNANELFYSNELNYGWDGAIQGRANICSAGIYEAHIDVSDTLGKIYHFVQPFMLYK
ncbi:MAG TPA: gliding motility-associated C-terminal domain-containing protein [Bacteroidia bacterium]|jgi:gliding motility-associated-like protein|nr:gliding motility-associated C-terminal domain-containing protein [Bacteroidia bacterium]